MAFSIEQILGFVPITAAVEKVVAGVPRVLPPAFYQRPAGDRVLGDKANNIAYRGTRKTARITPYGAPPRQIVQLPREAQPVQLLHTIENLPFKQELLLQLREPESYTAQRMAATEIAFQALNAGMRQENLESTAVHLAIANGKLWFDVDGNILPSSSGADLVVDYSVPSDNIGQVTPFGGSAIIDASWGTASTKIVTHVNAIKAYVLQKTGYRLKYAIYGKNIPEYLAGNTNFQLFLARNGGYNQNFVGTGLVAPGTLGLDWIPGQEAFFEDDTGTVQTIFGPDTIVFVPEVGDGRAWTIHEGSYPVPKSIMMAQNVEQMLGNFEIQYGRFGFAMMNPPSQIIGVYGDTFLPRLKVPEAFVIADVTP